MAWTFASNARTVSLAGTRVTGAIDARNATIARSLVWMDGTAEADADLSGAEFSGRAAFFGTGFLGRTSFSRAVFGATTFFSGRSSPPARSSVGYGGAVEGQLDS